MDTPPLDERKGLVERFVKAVSYLVIAARTSGGVAGRDETLCKALDEVEAFYPAIRRLSSLEDLGKTSIATKQSICPEANPATSDRRNLTAEEDRLVHQAMFDSTELAYDIPAPTPSPLRLEPVAWRGSDEAMRNMIAREIWRYQECPWDFDAPDGMMAELQKKLAVDQAELIRKVICSSELFKAYFAHHASPIQGAGASELEIVRLINDLRQNEGNSVTILCDNPDFNGQPNCAVICNGDWTDWQDKRFAADTLLDALSMAFVESKLPAPRKVIAESNGHHWIERFNLVCCRDCGFVRRADDKNKPCKGVVSVGPRDAVPAGASEAEIIERGGK